MGIVMHDNDHSRVISTIIDNSLPLPIHKSYKPLTDAFYGEDIKVITDLNVSILSDHDVRTRRSLLTRYYSVKARLGKSWKLAGHSPRLLIDNVSYSVSDTARRKVVERGSKEPHAFIKGTLKGIVKPDEMHAHLMMLKQFISNGARYIHYCPYRTEEFVVSSLDRLPPTKVECDGLELAPVGGKAYLFETGILYF